MKLGVCVRVYQYMCVCVCDVCGVVYVCVYHVLQYTKIKKSRHYIDYFKRCQLNSADVNVDDFSNFEDVFRQVKKLMNAGVFWNNADPHKHRLD